MHTNDIEELRCSHAFRFVLRRDLCNCQQCFSVLHLTLLWEWAMHADKIEVLRHSRACWPVLHRVACSCQQCFHVILHTV